jgi:hypothetical protein
MTIAPNPSPGGGGGGGVPTSPAFLLIGALSFGPFYAPNRLSVSKERELNRQETFCGGEDVTDMGSKNREIHVAGALLEYELAAFEALLDSADALDLTTQGWSGEVRVDGGEYEGPVGRDGRTQEYLFKYSLDLVSTGRDEDSGTSTSFEVTDPTGTGGVI